ncbi:hypothetical protein [Streptomyces sp. NPDC091416]|uniref:hypothetical protein n=1 Tax=Streptomyces sp. NPDC091416 TaxID=3366003 RepID=UPI00380BD8AD
MGPERVAAVLVGLEDALGVAVGAGEGAALLGAAACEQIFDGVGDLVGCQGADRGVRVGGYGQATVGLERRQRLLGEQGDDLLPAVPVSADFSKIMSVWLMPVVVAVAANQLPLGGM